MLTFMIHSYTVINYSTTIWCRESARWTQNYFNTERINITPRIFPRSLHISSVRSNLINRLSRKHATPENRFNKSQMLIFVSNSIRIRDAVYFEDWRVFFKVYEIINKYNWQVFIVRRVSCLSNKKSVIRFALTSICVILFFSFNAQVFLHRPRAFSLKNPLGNLPFISCQETEHLLACHLK